MSEQRPNSACQEDNLSTVKVKERRRGLKSCCQKVKDALSLVPKDANPPNWPYLWLIFISLFSSAFTLTFLFPFLPEMILTMGYKEEDKGTYAGLVASSVFAGRAVGSFFWGWLSDLKGRRLVLLVTIALNGLFSFLFGFVNDIAFAMVLRFLAGLSNGTVGVAKTVLYDVSDNTNQAFHMSIISIAWGSGLILGPTIGGYLALPARKYPNTFSPNGFLADYPFVLPSISCLAVCAVCFFIVLFKFQDPEPVVNKEVDLSFPTKGDDGHTDLFLEDDNSQRQIKNGGAVATATVSPAQQPLLPTHPEPSCYSVSSSPTVGMTLGMLHCEADIAYCYAQVENERQVQLLRLVEQRLATRSGEKGTWFSLHNLSPNDCSNGIESTHRRRCYSHGDQSPAETQSAKRTADSESGELEKAVVTYKERNSQSALTMVRNDGVGETAERNGDSAVNERRSLLQSAGEVINGDSKKGDGDHKNEKGWRSVSFVADDSDTVAVTDSGRKWCFGSCWRAVRNSALIKLLRIQDVQHSMCLYAVLSFAVIGYDDIFTVFASTSPDLDGLGFSTDEIGTALGVVSIPLMFIQIKLYPLIVSRFGIKKAYIINVFFVFVPVQLLPMLHLLVNNKVWLWVCLVTLGIPMKVAVNSLFAGSSLLINNSVTPDMAGKVNGIGMTASAIARSLAPTLGGAFFSWTLKSRAIGPPVDVNLTFFFFGFILFTSAVQCLLMPDHLDHQKK